MQWLMGGYSSVEKPLPPKAEIQWLAPKKVQYPYRRTPPLRAEKDRSPIYHRGREYFPRLYFDVTMECV